MTRIELVSGTVHFGFIAPSIPSIPIIGWRVFSLNSKLRTPQNPAPAVFGGDLTGT